MVHSSRPTPWVHSCRKAYTGTLVFVLLPSLQGGDLPDGFEVNRMKIL